MQYEATEWRLFLDSSVRSMKAVFLRIDNKVASVPVAHSVKLKECYLDMKHLLKVLHYDLHQWKLCGDLVNLDFREGVQSSDAFCVFGTLELMANIRDWPVRETFTPVVCNVKADSLVNPRNILLPPLHIKLGLMKNFVKALDKDGQSIRLLQTKFPYVSDSKLRAGVFDGPQIRELMKDSSFDEILTGNEKTAWVSFKNVCINFLGKRRSQDYKEMVGVLMQSFQALVARMSIKMHFLHSHLDYFLENCGDYCEEQGEKFHQNISCMEERFQGRGDVNILSDYCWCLKRDVPAPQHSQRALKRPFTAV